MRISTIANLLDSVQVAGQMALEAQRRPGALERSFKADGSVLTEIDGQVEEHLVAAISRQYPDANLVTEEAARPYDAGMPYTFTVDPIDGTDVYSQGMAGWCVSVGLQDHDLRPIAGIVYAPRLDLFFFADLGRPATLNGQPLDPPPASGPPAAPESSAASDPLSVKSNVMIPSHSHQYIDLRAFPGKARSIGSAALHLCFPVAYPAVVAGLQCPGAHIWDVAGAHAICASLGLCFEYWDGSPIDYLMLLDGSSIRDVIVSAPRPYMEGLKRVVARLAYSGPLMPR